MSSPKSISTEEFETIKHHIRAIRVALLTTQAPDGSLRSRPMVTQQIDPDGTMWFFTRNDSAKVDHVRHHPAIALGYENPETQVSVSTAGEAEVVKNQAKVDELWHDGLKDWFPEGKDDPNIVLLRITTHTGEYWA